MREERGERREERGESREGDAQRREERVKRRGRQERGRPWMRDGSGGKANMRIDRMKLRKDAEIWEKCWSE